MIKQMVYNKEIKRKERKIKKFKIINNISKKDYNNKINSRNITIRKTL